MNNKYTKWFPCWQDKELKIEKINAYNSLRITILIWCRCDVKNTQNKPEVLLKHMDWFISPQHWRDHSFSHRFQWDLKMMSKENGHKRNLTYPTQSLTHTFALTSTCVGEVSGWIGLAQNCVWVYSFCEKRNFPKIQMMI